MTKFNKKWLGINKPTHIYKYRYRNAKQCKDARERDLEIMKVFDNDNAALATYNDLFKRPSEVNSFYIKAQDRHINIDIESLSDEEKDVLAVYALKGNIDIPELWDRIEEFKQYNKIIKKTHRAYATINVALLLKQKYKSLTKAKKILKQFRQKFKKKFEKNEDEEYEKFINEVNK